MTENLTRLVTPGGEVIQAITADDLLAAAGITDPREAGDVELAAFDDNARHLAAITREARERVSEVLIERADKRGSWTLNVGEFKVTCPSPAAGATSYNVGLLVDALTDLVKRDVISWDAMESAVEYVAPEPFWKAKAQGVRNLLKLGGEVAGAIQAAQVEVEPPKRTAKIARAKS